MARRQRADINWKLFARIALIAWIVCTIWLFLPGIRCSVGVISGSGVMGPVGEDAVNANIPGRDHETASSDRSSGSVGGGIGGCFMRSSPLRAGAETPLAAASGSFVLFLLLSFIARKAHVASVKRSSKQQQKVRETVAARRGGGGGGGSGVSGPRASKRPTRQTGSALSLDAAGAASSTAGSLDLLDALEAQSSSAPPTKRGPDPSDFDPEWAEPPSVSRRASSNGAAKPAPTPDPAMLPDEDEVADDLDALFAMNDPEVVGSASDAYDKLDEPNDPPPRHASAPTSIEDAGVDDPFGSPLGMPDTPSHDGSSIGGWDEWESDDELNDLIAGAELPPGSDDDPFAIPNQPVGEAAVLPAQVMDDASGDATGLRTVRLGGFHVAGTDLKVGVQLTAPSTTVPQRARLEVHLVDGRNESWPLLDEPRPLAQLHGAEALGSAARGVLIVPWTLLAARLKDRVDEIDENARLRVSVELDGWEEVASAPLADHLGLQFVDEQGVPVEPSLLEVRTRNGDPIRLGIRDEGRLDRVPLPPGRYYVQRLDRLPIVTAQGATSTRAAVETDGLAMLRGQLRAGAVRRLVIRTPEVLYVSPTGDDVLADGTRVSPFGTLRAALDAGARRGTNRVIELRVEPGTRPPAERPGLVGREWFSWWSGRAANPRLPWTEQVLEPLARGRALPPSDERVDGQLSASGGEGVRLVNAALVDLRARAAGDRELLKRYNDERAALPMAVIAPPEIPVSPWRLAFDGCKHVHLEAVHVMGAAGESGVLVRNVRYVRIDRCWIDHFEGGRPASGAKWAVGRGLQVEKCGDSRDRVEIVGCDIGWNEAVRPSVPVRGAGIAIYGSAVRIDRCFIHDNAATKRPVDVVVDRGSLVDTSIASHRAGNHVVDA